MLAFIKNIGGPELIIVLVVVLLVFGAAKLPQLARSLGASAKEFKKGVDEGVDDDGSDTSADVEDSAT
jgi:sec-independent protein translocase protein TatA